MRIEELVGPAARLEQQHARAPGPRSAAPRARSRPIPRRRSRSRTGLPGRLSSLRLWYVSLTNSMRRRNADQQAVERNRDRPDPDREPHGGLPRALERQGRQDADRRRMARGGERRDFRHRGPEHRRKARRRRQRGRGRCRCGGGGGARGVRRRVVEGQARRARAADQQARRPDRGARRGAGADRDARRRPPDPVQPHDRRRRRDRPAALPGRLGDARSRARPTSSRRPANGSTTCCASRSGWSGRSCRGTSRWRWPAASSARRSPRAARWCSSPPSRRRCRPSSSASWRSRRAFPKA